MGGNAVLSSCPEVVVALLKADRAADLVRPRGRKEGDAGAGREAVGDTKAAFVPAKKGVAAPYVNAGQDVLVARARILCVWG